jgi:PEGA domain
MSPAGKKFDEDVLRKKIREQLEKEYSEKELKRQNQASSDHLTAHEEDESFYLEIFIRRKLQEEVYSKYPEFVKCGNHLDQMKWLTPLELEDQFEFFPLEFTFWSRFRRKASVTKKVKIPDTPEIKQMIEEFRDEIEEDARERVEKYRIYLKENQQKAQSGQEEKIFIEEQDRFYSSQKGYHKYKNHIGETAWMTVDEFETQEEFTERVYSKKEKARVGSIVTLIILLFAFGLYSLIDFLSPDSLKGYLVVGLNKNKASLYINHALAVGFTPGTAYPVNEGEHEITIISQGYKTDPGYQIVEISKGDTTTISFNLIPIAGETGTVRLNVPFDDASIFADGEFKGTAKQNRLLALPLGDHTITVKKPNYLSSPRLHTFSLNAGDTINLDFRLSKTRSTEGSTQLYSTNNTGLIEVNTNVRGARIILNGNNTGFESDYVLQKIPFGQHIISVEKDGYKVYPKEQVVRLSQNDRQAKANFTLTSTTGLVTINIHPDNATLFIDGKEASVGDFSGSLALGEHKLSFGSVEGYKTPEATLIDVSNETQNRFEFRYGSNVHIEVKPGHINPPSVVRLSSGYIMSGVNFKANSSNGPELVLNKSINENVWQIGFAFQYQNPPGSDAIFVRFQAPNDLNVTEDIHLKLWIYSTNDDYPLVIGGKAEYQVIFNNVIIVNGKTPKYTMSQISENNYEVFSLSSHIKSGVNTLIIAASPENSRFMQFWKAEIK